MGEAPRHWLMPLCTSTDGPQPKANPESSTGASRLSASPQVSSGSEGPVSWKQEGSNSDDPPVFQISAIWACGLPAVDGQPESEKKQHAKGFA